ncbi:MAG: ATP-dependent Clp protease adaptor ClpS [Bacteroidia bacterium]|jgi:ATP-dependent Clp protease adaptor protein ClpS|tara:strand:- start:12615 stop:12902 length:288 start_codon:yes stop_codon:yes gene_type:complete
MTWNIKTEELEELDVLVEVDQGAAIILYNDDLNTFDHVIYCLIKYCKHTAEQAEQCAMLVHYKGKCQVKNGSEIELLPICQALTEKGLSAVIEEL